MTPTPQSEGGTALQRKFTICADHKNAEWNQPQLEDGNCILCHLFYLEAQESLLEEWQQRAKRAEETIAEIERPLDSQMARLNQTVGRLNEELAAKERALQQARVEALEEAAKRCDSYSDTGREMAAWAKNDSARASSYSLQALAAQSCAESIRALKPSPASGEQINADALRIVSGPPIQRGDPVEKHFPTAAVPDDPVAVYMRGTQDGIIAAAKYCRETLADNHPHAAHLFRHAAKNIESHAALNLVPDAGFASAKEADRG